MPSKECLNGFSPEVILVIWKASLGGIEKSLIHYLNLLKDDFDIRIYSLRPVSDRENIYADQGTQTFYGNDVNLILYMKFFFFALKNRRCIFHLFNAGPYILFILRVARAVKVIYHIRGSVYWERKSERVIRKLFWRLSIRDKIIFLANSTFSKRRFLKLVDSRPKIKVVYNPFDTERFAPKKFVSKKKTDSDIFRIIYVGRLAKSKNLLLWIDVAEKIALSCPHIEFLLVGEGTLKEMLVKKIQMKNLQDRIKIVDFVEDVEKVYQESDLLLFLSAYESFGNVVVESILTNTPVIASDIPSMKEIFADYPQFLVPLDEDLVKNILFKIEDYDVLKRLTSDARHEFVKRYDVHNHIEQIRQMYSTFDE